MEQGVHAVYQIPMAYYENKQLTDELKKYILSKNSQGIESEVAFGLKTNLIESKFDFFNVLKIVFSNLKGIFLFSKVSKI